MKSAADPLSKLLDDAPAGLYDVQMHAAGQGALALSEKMRLERRIDTYLRP
jgi:hypothetical protein